MINNILENRWYRSIATIILICSLSVVIYIWRYNGSNQHEVTIDSIQENDLTFSLISVSGSSEYGDLFVVDQLDNSGDWQRIYDNNFQELKPWKLELGDIDGDQKKEILIAVHKTTHFDEQDRNRLFIFNFDGEKLYKKWTGSKIAGDWSNFFVGNLLSIPGDELIFIQQLDNQVEKLSIYYWLDFGFVQLAESERYYDIQNFKIIGDNHFEITHRLNNTTEKLSLTVKDGKIIEATTQE
ncbi:hypothetical protein [Paenibacillus endoradicis]|uniref:hypothetical protein n=1 Tax=Paenibacillus endoradicis TaxID=2972487 RepID=UPI002158D0E7|nr:hypothetical protein [Paenibacillus endoradicis]MCR8657997.1 hypothetical protein [Paenibacillus endoradicis]